MKCSICGCENEDGVQVCSACGAPVQAMVPCCHCGKPIRTSARFCVYCGGSQNRDAVPAPVEVPSEPAAMSDAEPVVADMPSVGEPGSEPNPEPAFEPTPEPVPGFFAPPPVCPVGTAPVTRPAYQLPTRRGLLKMLLLGILTCMIYPTVIISRISVEINMVASRHDGKRTVHFLFVPILSALTLGIYTFVWIHKLCNRIGQHLQRRGIDYHFGSANFWLWNVLWEIIGAVLVLILLALSPLIPELAKVAIPVYIGTGLLTVIGPLVFLHQLMKATNLMNQDYNLNG